MSQTTAGQPASKPVVIKIVATDGGFAFYGKQASIHPTLVTKSRWEILDLVAGWLARQGFLDGRAAGVAD